MNNYINIDGKRYWSVESVERGIGRVATMLRQEGMSDRPYVDAFNAALMEDDPDEADDGDATIVGSEE